MIFQKKGAPVIDAPNEHEKQLSTHYKSFLYLEKLRSIVLDLGQVLQRSVNTLSIEIINLLADNL